MGCERARERAPAHTWEVVRTQTTRETPSLSLSPPPPPFFFPVQWREGGKTRRGKGVSAAAAGGQIRKWPPFPFGGGSPNLFQDSLRCTSASVYVLCVQWLPRVSINVAEGFHLRGLASADPSPACGG